MHRLRRALASVSILCITSAGIVTATAGTGAADAGANVGVDGRVLTLNQSTGLDTRALTVSWSGFNPTRRNGQYTVNIVQCRANPTALDRDCFMATRYPNVEQGSIVLGATTRSDGTGSALIEIRSAIDLVELDCSSTRPCTEIGRAHV